MLRFLEALDRRVLAKCRARLALLQEYRHPMRWPEADYPGSGIYELRIPRAGHRYRILYVFHGRDAVLLSAFAKTEGRVPSCEIRLALTRLDQFTQSPEYHSHAVDTA